MGVFVDMARRYGYGATTIGLLGLALGVWAMFERFPIIAESGRKPTDVLSYSFWIPVFTVLGVIVGAALDAIARFVRWLLGR